MDNVIQFIRENVSEEDIELQLEEEIAEATAACCKLIRVLRGTNPTPVTEEEARSNLQEEIRDVRNLCTIRRINPRMEYYEHEFDGEAEEYTMEALKYELQLAAADSQNIVSYIGEAFAAAKRLGFGIGADFEKLKRWKQRLEEKQ